MKSRSAHRQPRESSLRATARREVPVVTVVTPVLNGERYLEGAIESVISQDYPRIEYIIVDGHSTDGTLDVVRRYGEQITRVVSEADRCQAEAINKGFALSTGDILTWLNYDDVLLPGALRRVADGLSRHRAAQFTYGHSQLIDGDGKVTKNLYTCRQSLRSYQADGGNVFQGTVFFTRDAWRECGPLDEAMRVSFEYKLFDEFFRRYDGVFINAKIAQYRLHEETVSRRFAAQFGIELASFRRRVTVSPAVRFLTALRRVGLTLLEGNLIRKALNR